MEQMHSGICELGQLKDVIYVWRKMHQWINAHTNIISYSTQHDTDMHITWARFYHLNDSQYLPSQLIMIPETYGESIVSSSDLAVGILPEWCLCTLQIYSLLSAHVHSHYGQGPSHWLIDTWEIRLWSSIRNRYLGYFLWYCPQVNAARPYWWLVNIGSGNGMVPSGSKPLPEPMLTRIYVNTWRH